MKKKNEQTGFAERVDFELALKCLSRKDLAEYCGIATPTIARWKSKGALPDVACGLKVAEFLGVSLQWLVTGKQEVQRFSTEDYGLLQDISILDDHDKDLVKLLIGQLKQRYEDR